MTSRFVCRRCGVVYGLYAGPGENPRRRELEACLNVRCFPVRLVLVAHARQLRADGPRSGVSNWEDVACAIETANGRFLEAHPELAALQEG